VTKKFVKVVSCKDSAWWYAKDIGAYYPLVRVQKDGSYVVESGNYNDKLEKVLACIASKDAEIKE